MASEIAEILDLIVNEATTQGSPVADYLVPGLTLEQLESLCQELDIRLNDQHREVYLWRGGTRISSVSCLSDAWLLPGEILLTLHSSSFHQSHLDLDKQWQPLFTDEGGGYFVVHNESGRVAGYATNDPIPRLAFNDVREMFSAVLACYREGAYYMDSDSRVFEVERDLQRQIWQRFNPSMEFEL